MGIMQERYPCSLLALCYLGRICGKRGKVGCVVHFDVGHKCFGIVRTFMLRLVQQGGDIQQTFVSSDMER